MPGLLSVIIFLPLLGGILLLLLPRENKQVIRLWALLFTGVTLALTLALLAGFDRNATGIQFEERFAWIPAIGIQYLVGVDGLSLPMVVLTGLLTFLAVIASWRIDLRTKEYFALLLVLETGVLGVFCALDFFLFFLFWEVELIPMYLLIGIWGGARREYAAIKFVIYTLTGSALMLVGILALYFYSPAPQTFDMVVLASIPWAREFQLLVFPLIFFGFAVKLPVFPFHTWLPDAHVEAPTAISVLLAGVLLKMGGYGMLRLIWILPDAAVQFALIIGILAVINVLYGALVSTVQTDLKSLVAYSSVSHMGYVLLGIAGLTAVSLNGAAVQLFTHGTITGLMFLLVGAVYDRTHTRQIGAMRGLAPKMPVIAALFMMAGLASLGLPGMSGFIAEFLIFVGAYSTWPVLTILGAAGIVITAGYILWMLQRVFFGRYEDPEHRYEHLTDVGGFEAIPMVTLVALILLIGIFPTILTDVISPGVTPLMARLGLGV
jgi:NADH-quinone oxidoreductase subunit M